VVVMVEVVDDQSTGKGHHRHHRADACLGRDERRDNSPPAPEQAERSRVRRRLRRAVPQMCRDRLRVGSHCRDQGKAHELEAAGGEPQRGEHVAIAPANRGLKTTGPRIAPNAAPKRTRPMPRARGSGGYMSPPAVRTSRLAPFAAPTPARPASTASGEPTALPSAATPQATTPTERPAASTGTRPKRSIERPAGIAASAPAASTMAGPRPNSPATSTTRTSEIDATATANWSMAEWKA
jgi:hypothetical protein